MELTLMEGNEVTDQGAMIAGVQCFRQLPHHSVYDHL